MNQTLSVPPSMNRCQSSLVSPSQPSLPPSMAPGLPNLSVLLSPKSHLPQIPSAAMATRPEEAAAPPPAGARPRSARRDPRRARCGGRLSTPAPAVALPGAPSPAELRRWAVSNLAQPRPVRVSAPVRIQFFGIRPETYPTRIHGLSVSDTYRIRHIPGVSVQQYYTYGFDRLNK